jgi:hypothetical protein
MEYQCGDHKALSAVSAQKDGRRYPLLLREQWRQQEIRTLAPCLQ